MLRVMISPYAMKQVAGTNRYEVAWTETDGICGCGRTEHRGEIEYVGEPGEEPDIVDLERAIRLKYHGNDSST